MRRAPLIRGCRAVDHGRAALPLASACPCDLSGGEVLDHRSQREVVVDVVMGDEDRVQGLVKVRPAGEELVQIGNQPRSRGGVLRSRINQHRPAGKLQQHTLALPDVDEMGGPFPV
jgi:hypothetical protein